MKAEIITVGNEIVFGHTVNTNASFIAQYITAAGILMRWQSAVCDEEKEIMDAVEGAEKRADLIVLTGGLGPTKDDRTKEAVCKHLMLELEVVQEELEKIQQLFKKQGKPMPENNIKQAAFPKGAQILSNGHGTAPGCIIEQEGKTYVLLPGPSEEMQPMFLESVLPYLSDKSQKYIRQLEVHCFGIGESALAERLDGILGSYSWGSIAPYISHYGTTVRLTASAATQEQAQQIVENYQKKMEACLEDFIIGYNNKTLEENIAQALRDKHLVVAVAESGAGGLLSSALVGCSGISQCFKEGIVAYSNEAKMKYLQVQKQTLKENGAVSRETAIEMAEGIRKAAGADIGLAETGIAGPGGGTDQKPVGLVYIAIATEAKTEVYQLMLSGSRKEIREKTVKHILFRLYQKLREK